MDFNFTQSQASHLLKSRQWAQEWIKPNIAALEENIDFRMHTFQEMAKEGFFSMAIPIKDKGFCGDALAYALALKEIAKVDAGIAVAMAVTNMVGELISDIGTDEQKKFYLPKFISGEIAPASFALTEKTAGSDPKNIQTLAQPESGNYILNGTKQFITNADIAGLIVIMAQTDAGITAFLLDSNTPGYKVIKKEKKLGLLTANLVEFQLEKCLLPSSNVLGKPGEGLKIALKALDNGRIGIAAQAIGIAEAAYEAALAYAQERCQFGHPLSENQAIAFMLADMHVKLQAAEFLLYKAIWKKNQGSSFTLEASEAKLYASEICNEIAGQAVQIFGGYGYIKDYPVEKYFRDARVTTIYEGTSEVQRIVISRALLADKQAQTLCR